MPHGPEDHARDKIDAMLEAAGWAVQEVDDYDPAVPQDGIAVREYPFESGPADYLLVIDREAVGVIEVKLEGTTLGDGAENTRDTVEREHTRVKRFRQSILKQAFSGQLVPHDEDAEPPALGDVSASKGSGTSSTTDGSTEDSGLFKGTDSSKQIEMDL